MRIGKVLITRGKPGLPDIPGAIEQAKQRGGWISMPHIHTFDDGGKVLLGPGITWGWERGHLRLFAVERETIAITAEGQPIEGIHLEIPSPD